MSEVKSCENCGRENKSMYCENCVTVEGFDIDYNSARYIPSNWVPKSDPENNDVVNHPSHYQTKSGLETIQVIEAFTEDLTGIEAVYTGNVIKYICRWNKKNGLQDLKKAQWYLDHLIEKVEEKENK